MKILIVDDMEMNLELLEARLEGKGYEVTSAKDGVEALEKLKKDSFAMIISDILMPKMDGFQLCRECKGDDTLRTIPFLFYTATYTDKKDEEFALSLGAESFIVKPMEYKRFMEKIEGVLERYKKGLLPPSQILVEKDEPVFLKEYNERLIKKLEDKVVKLEETERTLQQSMHDVKERVKELNCLYGIFKLTESQNTPLEEIIQGIVNLMPPSWQHPGATCVRIILDGKEYITHNFRETIWKQSSDIIVKEDRTGILEVYYLEEKPESDEGPFMKEERSLIDAIAERLGKVIERKLAAEEAAKLQSRLKQAQKMEALGTLAGGIAHDFNNILSAIIGYTELSKMKLPEDSKVRAYQDEIFKAGNRAKDLVKQILIFSRQTEHELKPVPVKFIIKEALALLRASLPSTIEIHQDTQTDSLVLSDPTQIHQILMNLCTNAGHAMEQKGGVLRVDMVDVELDSGFTATYPDLKPGPYIKLTVSDTGYGMSSEVMNRIFDPFFTTKERGMGTGMGLSVVHSIVESYGGVVGAYSEPGKGSAFKVFLPVIEGKQKSEAGVEKPIPKGTERILLVDDEPSLVEMGKELLEILGYEVTTSVSSNDALEIFKAEPERFDLVITDMTMPNMTGENLAKELIAIREDIPVILCTGFSSGMTEKNVKSMGIRAFVAKPILRQDMAETIRKVLDRGIDD